MRGRMPILVVFIVAVGAILPTAAGARRIVGHWYASDDSYFTGSACGETDTVTLRTRPRAFNVEVVTPLVGDSFEEDFNPGLVAATITDVTATRGSAGHVSVTWTATGSPNVCPPS